jgi:tetratricopeptide (TPR) repeat protein
MFGWFKTTSPLTDAQRAWLDARFAWLLQQFGEARLHKAVVTPTVEFFPEPYTGTADDAVALFNRVCHYMDVDPSGVELAFYRSAAADDLAVSTNPTLRGFALGTYSEDGGRIRIRLEQTRLSEPHTVVATLAHELGHVHLLGDGRCSADSADHEPLTDLLTVFFGMGIFTANSVIREANWRVGNFSGWNVSRQGYLGLAEYAYALAIYAAARGEMKPKWFRYLRPDLRALYKSEAKRAAEMKTSSIGRNANPASFEQLNAARANPIRGGDGESGDTGPAPADVDGEEAANATERIDDKGEDHDAAPGHADELYSRGVSDIAAGRYDLAVQALSDSLRLNPRDWEARLSRAQVYVILGKYAEAVSDCTQALHQEPDEPTIYRCRAQAYLWLRQWTRALDDLNIELASDKRDPTGHLLRGLGHAGLGQYEAAIVDYNKAIRFAPTFADNYVARSQAYAALGKAEEAEADLLEAISREPALSDQTFRAARLAGRAPQSGRSN